MSNHRFMYTLYKQYINVVCTDVIGTAVLLFSQHGETQRFSRNSGYDIALLS